MIRSLICGASIVVFLSACSGSSSDAKSSGGASGTGASSSGGGSAGTSGSSGKGGSSTGGTAASGGGGGEAGAGGSGGTGQTCGSGGSSPAPTGAVYYVATDGSDSNSCEQAKNPSTPKRNIMGTDGGIACLQVPGETLMIREGTYEERITNFESVTWPTGNSWTEAFTVKAYPGETVTVRGIAIATNEDNAACPEGCDIGYWIFDGLHSVNTIGGEAIWTRNPHHIRFINMEASTASRKDQCVQGGGHHMEYINVEVHHCGDPNMEPCGGACGASYGFYWGGDDSLFDHIQLHDTTGYGFHIFSAQCNDVSSNCPDRNVVRFSEIHDTGTKQGSSAILFAYGTGNEAYGNVIWANSQGISVGYGASDSKIFNNTIYANQTSGIAIGTWGGKATSNTLVKNNLIVENTGVAIDVGAYGTIDEPAGTVLEFNLFAGNTAGDVLDTGSGTTSSNNATTSPSFVDSGSKDLHLQAGSSGVDTATALGAPYDVDKDGVCRPAGGGWDVGAYER